MSKVRKIAFLFLVSITLGNFGLMSAPLLGASELEYDVTEEPVYTEVMSMSEEEYDSLVTDISIEYGINLDLEEMGKERAIAISAILAAAAKIFGKALVGWIAKKIADMGLRSACKAYNDSNKAWDFVCDAANQYRDRD